MKKILLHYGFIIPAILFLLHQISQLVLNYAVESIDNYLDPFCGAVIVLHALSLERWVIFEQRLTSLDVLIALIILVSCSELIFPYFSGRFTADVLDLVAFALGGLWFLMTRKDILIKKYE